MTYFRLAMVTGLVWGPNYNGDTTQTRKDSTESNKKGFRPHGLLVYRLCLPPDTAIIFIF